MPGTTRPLGYTEPSAFRIIGPIAPARGRSPASFTNRSSVPSQISVSGFSTRTNGAVVAPIPTFTPAANPRFVPVSMTSTAGKASPRRGGAPVARRVVDDDDLDLGVPRVREHRREAPRQVRPGVVVDDDDREIGHEAYVCGVREMRKIPIPMNATPAHRSAGTCSSRTKWSNSRIITYVSAANG